MKTLPFLAALALFGCSSSPSTPANDAVTPGADAVADTAPADAPAADAQPADVQPADVASDRTAPSDGAITCAELGPYCHDVDPGTGPIHDCHEGGHDAVPAWCDANFARCYTLCTEARRGDGGAADAHVHNGDAASTDAAAGHDH